MAPRKTIKKSKRAAHPLHEIGSIFTVMVEHSPVGKFLIGGDGKIIYLNPKAELIFGYPQKELVGHTIEELLPERYRGHHGGLRASFMAHPSPRPMGVGRHLFALHKSGKEFPVEIGLVPVKMAGGMAVLASVVDVTAQKEKEQLERELLHRAEAEQRRIGQDLHDSLGQELLAISFLSNVLKKKLTNQSLPEAEDAAQIEDLLNQAKSNVRKLSRDLYAADLESRGLGGAIKDMVDHVRETSATALHFEGDENIRLSDHTLSEHLYKLAQEAMNNAIKHSFAKNITVTLQKMDHEVTLGIRDDGVGMSSSAPHTGGLGLRTMRYRANVMGASLDIKSQERSGTLVACVVHVS